MRSPMTSSLSSRRLDDLHVEEPEPESADRPAPATRAPSVHLRRVLLALSVLTVAALHFRPWQGAMLEDWGLAASWEADGAASLLPGLRTTLGRPFHLLPHYLGMALSDGGVL